MKDARLRFRQIHLDFHTSEKILGVGSKFNPKDFVSTLEKAHVNSVTCFARCHHGWIYFDTKKFPERRHPQLIGNLLREQIEACHESDIRVPIYITVQWDHYTARKHPEWLIINEEGCFEGTKPYEAGFYQSLCLNTPYIDFLKAHVKEILETLPTDGIFFDIVKPQDCSCRYCREGMESEGLEASDIIVRKKYGLKIYNKFKFDMTKYVRTFNTNCTIFYNSGHIGPIHRSSVEAYTHFELESLPSGGWGYMHFPISIRYARNLGIDCIGMTGKFHTSWGDFHSYKNLNALRFECFRMLALNTKCSIGDQLHPQGEICKTTYKLIGSVYTEVEKKEPWCRNANPISEIGVFNPEEFRSDRYNPRARNPAAIGACRMLQEGFHQFDIIDSSSNLSRYKVLVLPDNILVSENLAARIEKYFKQGGSVIASFKSGLNLEETRFELKHLGVKLKGPARFSPDFILPKGEIGKNLTETEHVMYMKGMEVELKKGEILAETMIPYFNRTYKHFCSHRHTPSSNKIGYPGITRNKSAIYFMHPIFTQYHENAPKWCKILFHNALKILLPEPILYLEAPSTTLATVNEQVAEKRWVLHLIHYIPERRGQAFDTIEDSIPLYDVGVHIKTPKPVNEVLSVPDNVKVDFQQNNGRTHFKIPKIDGHQMISIQFSK